MIKAHIKGRILIHAELRNLAPLRIGAGAGDDRELLLLLREGRPYIPGSSLAGVLRAKWKADFGTQHPEGIDPDLIDAFWGTSGPDQSHNTQHRQSHFLVRDLCLAPESSSEIVLRDGVSIDRQTRTAKDGFFYRYEILEPGSRFLLRAEITLREGMELAPVGAILHWIHTQLFGDLQVGSNTSKGFGLLGLTTFQAWHFAFPAQASDWFAYCRDGKQPNLAALPLRPTFTLPVPIKQDFCVRASFALRSSLLIGAGRQDLEEKGTEVQETRKGPLRSGSKPVISGKSLIGAMRQRAHEILVAGGLDALAADAQLARLFGYAETMALPGQENARPQRSRISTREADLSQAGKMMQQQRIRVDRFSAAPVDTGLFESAPLWRIEGGRFELQWRIERYADWEASLLLHLLRDLWTGDLALGGEKNIGRGVLRGLRADIHAPGIQACFEADSQGRLQWLAGKGQLDRFDHHPATLFPSVSPIPSPIR
jgi:CRISPR/Cas system CSM-associated protein Csm3 (group 7 of RAMP superfamily)